MKAIVASLLILVVLGGVAAAVDRIDVPPRSLAPWVERRAAGHRSIIQHAGRILSTALLTLDRGREAFHNALPVPAWDTAPAREPAAGRQVIVGSPTEALHAIATARPGDVITFIPGTYRFDGVSIDVQAPGAPEAPITVRADKPGNVVLEFNMVDGFLVTAPYWIFENLTIRGICADHSNCEHAFHVVGGAAHFVARRNEIVDFNAQFGIDGSRGDFPDWGVIEGNVLRNASARETTHPVTPIDLVAASHWRIRGNRISDFVKAGGNRASRGAFVGGGGADNQITRNVVVCEDRLRRFAGQRIGLWLGGAGTSRDACRDRRCITEQEHGVIASNLIASCSDDGIHLSRAAMSTVSHNTLLDTAGITARFGESSGDVDGNLVDGGIRAVRGAVLHASDNRVTAIPALYFGWHPVRRLFAGAPALDLRWRGDPPRRRAGATAPPDLCNAPRPATPAYGAFEDISRCRTSAD
jgi:hypothetical protein